MVPKKNNMAPIACGTIVVGSILKNAITTKPGILIIATTTATKSNRFINRACGYVAKSSGGIQSCWVKWSINGINIMAKSNSPIENAIGELFGPTPILLTKCFVQSTGIVIECKITLMEKQNK